jgi:hypothetical protein
MGEDAALEIAPNFPLDEASDGGARRSRACEERFELGSDDGVEESLLGLVTFVTNRGVTAGTGRASSPSSKRSAGWCSRGGPDSPCPLSISGSFNLGRWSIPVHGGTVNWGLCRSSGFAAEETDRIRTGVPFAA